MSETIRVKVGDMATRFSYYINQLRQGRFGSIVVVNRDEEVAWIFPSSEAKPIKSSMREPKIPIGIVHDEFNGKSKEKWLRKFLSRSIDRIVIVNKKEEFGQVVCDMENLKVIATKKDGSPMFDFEFALE